MEKNLDKRIIKTRKLIQDALTQLMKEKGFDKITVKDITEKAFINRATFYLHYKDKYDLLEQSENSMLEEIELLKSGIRKTYHGNFIPISNQNNIVPFLTKLYEYISKNSEFMKVILGPNGDLNFQIKLKSNIENFILENAETSKNINNPNLPIKYLTVMASSCQLGVIQKWLEDGMKESPKELACIVSKFIFSVSEGTFKH